MSRVLLTFFLLFGASSFAVQGMRCSQRILPNEWSPKEISDGFLALVKHGTPLFESYLKYAVDPKSEAALIEAVPSRSPSMSRLLGVLRRRFESLGNAGIFHGVAFQQLHIKKLNQAELREGLLDVLGRCLLRHPKLTSLELLKDEFTPIGDYTLERLHHTLSGPMYWAFLRSEFGGFDHAKRFLKSHSVDIYETWRNGFNLQNVKPKKPYLASQLENPLFKNRESTEEFIKYLLKNHFSLSRNNPPSSYKNGWLGELSYIHFGEKATHADLEIASIVYFGGWPQMMGEILAKNPQEPVILVATQRTPPQKPIRRPSKNLESISQGAVFKKLKRALSGLDTKLQEKAEDLVFHISQSPDILSEEEVLSYLVQETEYGLTEVEAQQVLKVLKKL